MDKKLSELEPGERSVVGPSHLCSKTTRRREGMRALITVVMVLMPLQAYGPAVLGQDMEISINAPETVSGYFTTIDLSNVVDLDSRALVEVGTLII